MTENEIIEKLKPLLINEFDLNEINPEDIRLDTPLFGEGLGLDSIDAVELVVILEKHFKVTIKDGEEAREAFNSFGSLMEYILNKQGN